MSRWRSKEHWKKKDKNDGLGRLGPYTVTREQGAEPASIIPARWRNLLQFTKYPFHTAYLSRCRRNVYISVNMRDYKPDMVQPAKWYVHLTSSVSISKAHLTFDKTRKNLHLIPTSLRLKRLVRSFWRSSYHRRSRVSSARCQDTRMAWKPLEEWPWLFLFMEGTWTLCAWDFSDYRQICQICWFLVHHEERTGAQ